jgi:hypothetical protein
MNNYDIFGIIVIIVFLGICFYIFKRNNGDYELKCIISTVDGNQYCVRERDHIHDAADLLATVTDKCNKLVIYVKTKYPENDDVVRLEKGFNPTKIMETLPTSKYTAYSENKGEKLVFCLQKKKDEVELIDENTLTFVAIHELAHVMTKSIGHKSEFWNNFKFLLENAKDAGIHNPIDYRQKPKEYCGMKINDNPYYDV